MLSGRVEGVRYRLQAALEHLGYEVIEEETPALQARRAARGRGTWWGSADVID